MNYYQRLQSSIDFIENNVTKEFALTDVASKANCSLYHFHRLFQAIVGNSVKEYVRKRRLSFAARDLVNSKKSIIDIAFDYQYTAPEAFSRAFKKMYGLSPWQYRKWGAYSPLHKKANLLEINFEKIKGELKVKPRIIEKDQFLVVGIELSTHHKSCQQDVPGFWQEFSQKNSFNNIPNAIDGKEIFGICYGKCDGKCGDTSMAKISLEAEDTFGYLICSEVSDHSDVPDGFIPKTLPKGKYAVFTVKGGFAEIKKAINSIYKSWLPNTSYELAHSPDLERYDERWTGGEDSEMEIWIPIK